MEIHTKKSGSPLRSGRVHFGRNLDDDVPLHLGPKGGWMWYKNRTHKWAKSVVIQMWIWKKCALNLKKISAATDYWKRVSRIPVRGYSTGSFWKYLDTQLFICAGTFAFGRKFFTFQFYSSVVTIVFDDCWVYQCLFFTKSWILHFIALFIPLF